MGAPYIYDISRLKVNIKFFCCIYITKNGIRYQTARQSFKVYCSLNIIHLLSNCHSFICGVTLCTGPQALHGSCFTHKKRWKSDFHYV